MAWLGRARHGMARHGEAWRGKARRGLAGQGTAGQGKAGHGEARQGKARNRGASAPLIFATAKELNEMKETEEEIKEWEEVQEPEKEAEESNYLKWEKEGTEITGKLTDLFESKKDTGVYAKMDVGAELKTMFSVPVLLEPKLKDRVGQILRIVYLGQTRKFERSGRMGKDFQVFVKREAKV